MPKQKMLKKNDAAHQESQRPLKRSKAPQAAAHRRGGTHRVRDEDKTNSIYDTYNYRELVDAAKERGIYRKDMKKMEMAWALKRNDGEKKLAERENRMALQRKKEEAKREQERIAGEKEELLKAKQRKKVEKMRRRERDESVSDDTASEDEVGAVKQAGDEYKREAIGKALSDTSWDSSSAESISDFDSADQVLKPSCKLQLLEWPYQTMPPVEPDSSIPHFLDPQPRQIPYAALRVTTTLSKQKICLPGLKYPSSIDPDYVPIVPTSVRTAAHKGHLKGILRNASIETGEQWASRTLVQGSTATLYFHPSNLSNPTKSLASVYEKWNLEKRWVRRVHATHESRPGAREARKRYKKRYRGRMMAEVYETCKWRPTAVGYIPAYLDFDPEAVDEDEDDQERSLENLRFVRFSGCDVPHYYFWVSDGKGGEEDGEVEEVRQYEMVGARKRPYKIVEQEIEEDGEREEARQRPLIGARKKPYRTDQPPPDRETCKNETPTNDKTESVLEEIGSDTSAEGLFHKASTTSMFSEETDRNYSIDQWLDHIEPSCDGPPTPVTLSDSSDIVGSSEKDKLHGWKGAFSYISEQEMGEERPFKHTL